MINIINCWIINLPLPGLLAKVQKVMTGGDCKMA